ncbi:hypothetical protein [Paenibacillus prosopidis]|uniref:Uncharacterized protein n=1 Tax=Paenibacillus prosopidis TaxID=630520 RepID=A0A368W2U6_9BACL|nr:hypothetical protein [Paenibacillus prosopidis]RCW48994.1 hypothetical protein DFP97_105179 [Paenibacillus prosopidis]
MAKKSSINFGKVKKDNTKIKFKQGASASVGSNGNAFAINASDVAVVRIRP